MADIAEKDTYAQLTDKQQRVVDEYAEDPTAQNTVLAERAGVSRATVYNVKDHYGDILERRLNQRGRDPGEERTEGDPFADVLDEPQGPQTIGERPHQPTRNGDADDEDADTDAEASVTLRLDEATVRDAIEREEWAGVRCALVQAVLRQAFAED